MVTIVLLLTSPSAVGLVNSRFHRPGHPVGIEYCPTVHISCGPADSLNKRTGRTQKPLFIGIENSHKRDFGEIEPLTKQVYPYQNIKNTCPQITQNLHPFNGIDIGVKIAHLNLMLAQVLGQILSHSLGQGRHQDALISTYSDTYF